MKKKKEYRNADGKPLKLLIDKMLKAYGLDKKMNEIDVLNGWKEMMGVAVANRTLDLKIYNKTLIITLDSSVMREELSHGKQVIIERVNQYAKKEIITDVWLK